MTATIQAPTAPEAVRDDRHGPVHIEGQLTYVIRVEPMTDDMRDPAIGFHRYAVHAVTLRFNEHLVRVITTDNDPDRRVDMDLVAKAYAAMFEAALAPRVWPHCPWCGFATERCPDLHGNTTIVCPDPLGHSYLDSASETSWRRR